MNRLCFRARWVADLYARLKRRLVRSRVPLVLQMTQSECAAACLSMIVGYFGAPTALARTREALNPGRDGTSALELAQTARSFGLRTRAVSVDPHALAQVQVPAIIHWEFRHFLVLERWTSGGADVVDPASGRRHVTAPELDKHFTGVVLMFEPGPSFQRQRAVRRLRVLAYLGHLFFSRESRRLLPCILGLSLLVQAAGLVLPLATGLVVDRFLPRGSLQPGMLLAGLLICTALAYGIVGYLRAVILVWLQARSGSQSTVAFARHLVHLPLAFFQQRPSGDVLMRLASHTLIRDSLTSQTLSTAMDGVLVLGYLAILFACDPVFGFVTLSFVTLQVMWLALTTDRVRGFAAAELAAQAASQACASEMLKGITTVKALASEPRVLEYWSRLLVRQVNLSVERGRVTAAIEAVFSTLRVLVPIALLLLGCLRVLSGQLSLGTLFALLALAGGLLGPLASLLKTLEGLGQMEAHLQRLDDVLESRPEADDESLPRPSLSGRIELREVSFCYPGQSHAVIRDVSLLAEPGQKIGLVGETGSGKSTLALLLLGLLEPAGGTVLFDGTDLQRLSRLAVRCQIGTVLQEPFIFSGSIRHAIAFHAPEVDLDAVRRAARLAAIDDEIMALPMGYDTLLGEGGSGLSGGQRQRLALARALVHVPRILLLDEATSQMDVLTEQRVERNLRQVGCTRIVIAHRLRAVADADAIYVLNGGRIVEHGTHAELVDQGGAYAALWRAADVRCPAESGALTRPRRWRPDVPAALRARS